ncbi:MAG: hypothetical protein CMJ48_01890 [Planctomycetaceae bacterium]|nr:hypothetical protein [Planctomycetaceae bacterium]
MANRPRTLDQHLLSLNVSTKDLAERADLALERVEAIAYGRWTPSPDDRATIAAALDLQVTDVIWGHTLDPRNIRYRQFGMPEDSSEGGIC